MAAFALSTSYALSVVLLFAAGLLDLTFNSMGQALVQLEAPSHLRGRVIGLYNMAAQGMRAFAGVTVGLGTVLVGDDGTISAGLAPVHVTGIDGAGNERHR